MSSPRGLFLSRLRDESGRLIEIRSVRVVEGGKKIFLDRAGKTIQPAVFAEPKEKRKPSDLRKVADFSFAKVRKFNFGGIPVFLDLFGNVIETEQGQADGTVLIALRRMARSTESVLWQAVH